MLIPGVIQPLVKMPHLPALACMLNICSMLSSGTMAGLSTSAAAMTSSGRQRLGLSEDENWKIVPPAILHREWL
eukprot:2323912-Amphidinium_carterae.1